MEQEVFALMKIMIERYGFGTLISDFCNGIEIIENNDFYDYIMDLLEMASQRNKIMKCKKQFENIDATIIMPQKINKKAYILLKTDLSLEASIRKMIHEFIHLVHRCIITKKMKSVDLYEIEDNQDYKLFYYLDEFLTKKKEIMVYYDLLHKNHKIVDDNIYITTMAKKFEIAKESSDILSFMRDELFAIAETMAYQHIFADMFPEKFIENQVDISGVVEILNKFDSIEEFIKNRSELEIVINMLEKNYYASHQ